MALARGGLNKYAIIIIHLLVEKPCHFMAVGLLDCFSVGCESG